jgi:uncharacterized membrane protein
MVSIALRGCASAIERVIPLSARGWGLLLGVAFSATCWYGIVVGAKTGWNALFG